MTETIESRPHPTQTPPSRAIIKAGAIVLLTGAVAGSLYCAMPPAAYACSDPPCGSPAPAPP